jgi:hypothetical protein
LLHHIAWEDGQYQTGKIQTHNGHTKHTSTGKNIPSNSSSSVDVKNVFHVLPRGKGKEVLTKRLATLTLTMGQEVDTTMP